MSELTGPGVSTCERHKSRASRQKSGRRRPMRRQSGFLAGNGERGPNLTAIFHPPVFPHGLQDLCTVLGNFGHPLCFSDDHLQLEDRLVIATGLAQLQRVMIARVARV
jgi:hypothetical protein